jgi:hypothetical protein
VLALASLSPRDRTDHAAARVVASHAAEQRWSLLCNGVVLFVDTGVLLPGGRVLPPHRSTGIGPLRRRDWVRAT